MPFLEYKCENGHVSEHFYKTFAAAEGQSVMLCSTCNKPAPLIYSVPLGFSLYGNPDGWTHPSPSKRYNTKTVSQKEGNRNACG